jgi:hypothetical protein
MANEGYRGDVGVDASEPILFGNDERTNSSGAPAVEDQAGNSSMMKIGVRAYVPLLFVST